MDIWITYIIPIGTQLIIAFTAIYIVRKQIVNAGVTQFRQQWIDNLRNTISEFYSTTKNIMLLWNRFDKHNRDTEAIYKEFEEKVSKIKLLINPNESDHRNLINIVDRIDTDLYDPLYEDKDINNLLKNLIDCTQAILKREWERVKKGE